MDELGVLEILLNPTGAKLTAVIQLLMAWYIYRRVPTYGYCKSNFVTYKDQQDKIDATMKHIDGKLDKISDRIDTLTKTIIEFRTK